MTLWVLTGPYLNSEMPFPLWNHLIELFTSWATREALSGREFTKRSWNSAQGKGWSSCSEPLLHENTWQGGRGEEVFQGKLPVRRLSRAQLVLVNGDERSHGTLQEWWPGIPTTLSPFMTNPLTPPYLTCFFQLLSQTTPLSFKALQSASS